MNKSRRKTKPLFTAVIIGIIAAALITIGVSAKYITRVKLEGKVIFNADLADEVIISEHEANRGNDGVYSLNETETLSNSYIVMPGVDIPKDPFITIKNKSNIDSYLYVEIIEKDLPSAVIYALTEDWTKLEAITDRNIYVYNKDFDTETDIQKIQILKDNMLYVMENYDPENTASFDIKIVGYMAQKEGGKGPDQIFNDNFKNP